MDCQQGLIKCGWVSDITYIILTNCSWVYLVTQMALCRAAGSVTRATSIGCWVAYF